MAIVIFMVMRSLLVYILLGIIPAAIIFLVLMGIRRFNKKISDTSILDLIKLSLGWGSSIVALILILVYLFRG